MRRPLPVILAVVSLSAAPVAAAERQTAPTRAEESAAQNRGAQDRAARNGAVEDGEARGEKTRADVISEEIVVTGEFRESGVDSLPSSVSVVQPEDPRRTVVQQIEQVLGWVPNVNFSSGASRAIA